MVARQVQTASYGRKAPRRFVNSASSRRSREKVGLCANLRYLRRREHRLIAARSARPGTRQAIGTLSVAGPSVRMTAKAMDRMPRSPELCH